MRVVYPSGSVHVYKNVPTPAMVPTQLSGTGAYSLAGQGRLHRRRRRAVLGDQHLPAPRHSAGQDERRRLAACSHPAAGRDGRDSTKYIVQISSTPDFSHTVETDNTEGTVAGLEPQRVHRRRRAVLLARRGDGRRRQRQRLQLAEDLQDPPGDGELVPRPSRASVARDEVSEGHASTSG